MCPSPRFVSPLPRYIPPSRRVQSRRGAVGLVLITLLAVLAPRLDAATIVVDSSSDQLASDTRCTLREAVASANQDMALFGCTTGSGPDTIVLDFSGKVAFLSLAGSVEDDNQTGDLDVKDDLTIRSASPDNMLTIDADGIDRVLDVFDGVDLTLEDVQISGGSIIAGNGGGIFVRESGTLLHLINTRVLGNTAPLFGGGIFATGPVTIEGSLIESNEAAIGGGIYLSDDDVLTLDGSRVNSNRATSDGAGIAVLRLVARDSTIAKNRADRDGGGILWRRIGASAANVSSMVNSTVAENSSFRDGAGLLFESPGILELANVTVAWNIADEDFDDVGTGGGLVVTDGQVRARNTLIASNFDVVIGGASLTPSDCVGTLDSQGTNLIGAVDAGCTITGTTVGNVTGTVGSPVDAELACLAQIGLGPGTVVPSVSSPVVDAGAVAGCLDVGGGFLDVDQRGHLRPWDGP
ncbi:MAG: right-handed parallel beta-helix repeat-containing protein, partial [Acidobacteriota bacterium]